jgi:hypothetical protein
MTELFFFPLFLFDNVRIWTQCFMLARNVLYYLSYNVSFLNFSYFSDILVISHHFAMSQPLASIIPISASWIAWIIYISHHIKHGWENSWVWNACMIENMQLRNYKNQNAKHYNENKKQGKLLWFICCNIVLKTFYTHELQGPIPLTPIQVSSSRTKHFLGEVSLNNCVICPGGFEVWNMECGVRHIFEES